MGHVRGPFIKGGIPMKVSDETMLFRKVDDEPMTAEEVLTQAFINLFKKKDIILSIKS